MLNKGEDMLCEDTFTFHHNTLKYFWRYERSMLLF